MKKEKAKQGAMPFFNTHQTRLKLKSLFAACEVCLRHSKPNIWYKKLNSVQIKVVGIIVGHELFALILIVLLCTFY